MKKKILISTIVRDEAKFLDMWYFHVKKLVESNSQNFEFFLSVYENDSKDGSFEKLSSFDYSFFGRHRLTSERLSVPYFIGGMHPMRTQILAYARNSSIYGFYFLKEMDFVLSIETDVRYDAEKAKLILCDHEAVYGKKFDILTGFSHHPNLPNNIYDSWGTRKTNNVEACDESHDSKGIEPLWSVFNCFALYNAEPIKRGISFGGFNNRLNKPDCDTAVICENFRANGHNEIYWNADFKVEHYCEHHTLPDYK